MGKCHVALGSAGPAQSVLGKALRLAPGDAALRAELQQANALAAALESTQQASLRSEYRVVSTLHTSINVYLQSK